MGRVGEDNVQSERRWRSHLLNNFEVWCFLNDSCSCGERGARRDPRPPRTDGARSDEGEVEAVVEVGGHHVVHGELDAEAAAVLEEHEPLWVGWGEGWGERWGERWNERCDRDQMRLDG